jgi:hypothetical protein
MKNLIIILALLSIVSFAFPKSDEIADMKEGIFLTLQSKIRK